MILKKRKNILRTWWLHLRYSRSDFIFRIYYLLFTLQSVHIGKKGQGLCKIFTHKINILFFLKEWLNFNSLYDWITVWIMVDSATGTTGVTTATATAAAGVKLSNASR